MARRFICIISEKKDQLFTMQKKTVLDVTGVFLGEGESKEERTDFREASFGAYNFSSSSITVLCNRINLEFISYSFF